MSDKEKKSAPKWLEKLKNIKHIEVYIAIIFVVILVLIYLANFTKTESKKEPTTSELNVISYIDNLEQNLEDILSNINGVENVKVMITLNMVEAEVNESKIVLNSFPSVKGVIITANGVNDTSVKMKVLHAVQAVLDITNSNIEILSSN